MLAQVPVTVVIPEFVQIDNPDFFVTGDGDYYADVRIGPDPAHSSRAEPVTGSHIYPGWSFTSYVDDASGSVPVQISIFDDDVIVSTEDPIDVDPNAGDNTLDLVFDLETGHWSGDVSWPTASSGGDGADADRGLVYFDIFRSIPVTVAISELLQLENPDAADEDSGDGDFYAKVQIGDNRVRS